MDSSPHATEEIDAPRPFWIPEGVRFDSLPEELKVAISGVINPAYKELVLCASSGLEQSTGLTVVQLLWLEILEQIQIGKVVVENSDEQEDIQKREAMIARYLRLAGAKNKTSNLLIRLHDFRQKWGSFPAGQDPLKGVV